MIGLGSDNPVIIFGMHRSGTTIVGDLLEKHGLFSGVQQDVNRESTVFQAHNKWLMASCGARWDAPEQMKYLWADAQTQALTVDYLRSQCASLRNIRYTGIMSHFGFHGAMRQNHLAWGWKDPRNTFTLPIWEKLFPRARFIYVERHGVDVAQSLLVRHRKEMKALAARRGSINRLRTVFPRTAGFAGSVRCATLDGAFSLWKAYVDEGRNHVRRLGPSRVACVQFEDLCHSPRETLGGLLDFLEMGKAETVKEDAIAAVTPQRASAHQSDPQLAAYAVQKAGVLQDTMLKPLFD